MRSQKSPCAPWMPKSFGSCVLARYSATPALKPTSTVSDTKLTTAPPLKSQTRQRESRHEQRRAGRQRRDARRRRRSPSSPSVAPTSSEIADVTVIAVCRELQKSQKTSPEKRHAYSPASGGSWASDASAMPAGSR